MNSKRLILAVIVGFVFYLGSDIIIHGVWLGPEYKATAALWRSDAEMTARMPFMIAAHFLYAHIFVLLWAKGFAAGGHLKSALLYGLLMGLFFQSSSLISYVVTPVPLDIVMKWFLSGLAQGAFLGVLTFLTCRPREQNKPQT